MASRGIPHQPLPAVFPGHFGKDSLGQSNAGLLDSRGGPAVAAALPLPEIHPPRHIVPDERDAFISWLRGEFAAANAIIDALCHHLRMIGEPSEYDFVLTCIQQRRINWTLVLQMQQFFSVAEVIYALQQATWRRQQARNASQTQQHRSIEEINDPRALTILRGLKGEVPPTLQSEISISDMAAAISRDPSLSDLSVSQEVLNGKKMQSPVARVNDLGASQSLSISGLDPCEQSATGQVPMNTPNRAIPKSPDGLEAHADVNHKDSIGLSKSPELYAGKVFAADFTALSKEEQDARLPMIKVSKHFQCWEHVEGSLVNVVEGLELFENVLNSYEASQVAVVITEMQGAGRRGELGEKTFFLDKRLTGKPKELIQFSSDNHKNSGDMLEPMPLVFNSLIDRLILWHILPASKRPDYCCIEVLEEGEDCRPFLSYQHVDQYLCCLFLMAESTLILGHKLTLDSGDYKNRFKLQLPSGSALVIQGNSAAVSNRAILPSPGKRTIVTFAKLLGPPSGGKYAHPVPPNFLIPSTAMAWPPPVALPGGATGVHGIVPAVMKHFGMVSASGVLPIPSVRPLSHAPHHIPPHLVNAPGSVPAMIPTGPRAFPPMGVLSRGAWPPVPPQAPPRPPNTGTGVFFPAGGSSAGSPGRPINPGQAQGGGALMASPILPKSEQVLALSPPPTTIEGPNSFGPRQNLGSSNEARKANNNNTRKESPHKGLKAGANSNIKDEQQQQQRRGFHSSNNKGGGAKV